MDIDDAIKILKNPKNVKFNDILRICKKFFKGPRISGSHYIFKTSWKQQPLINIQKDKKMAKQYQVRQIKEALQRLKGTGKGKD